MTEDYLLLEQGEILDVDGEHRMMPLPSDDYKRADSFDFRRVSGYGDTAYVVYSVTATVANKKKPAQNGEARFPESAVLRRSGAKWRVALLHATQVRKAAS